MRSRRSAYFRRIPAAHPGGLHAFGAEKPVGAGLLKRHPFLIDHGVGAGLLLFTCGGLFRSPGRLLSTAVDASLTAGGLFRSPARQVAYLPAAAGDRQGAIKRHGPLTPDFRQFLRGFALPSRM
ncbi:hypothetical protein BTJ39_14495 [Izhakiella australiensis]|uniref:Uncharacterized protein n=1 Tax=Izhakiella australiensis TaxID=1926881 RepID=A0A1S8YK96_9GAMM|nr:hypothetical protein [Izhakiella australiensis]OON39146.1 hypothetical protein BTJ39_14495 [Izhakiella australiensis]